MSSGTTLLRPSFLHVTLCEVQLLLNVTLDTFSLCRSWLCWI